MAASNIKFKSRERHQAIRGPLKFRLVTRNFNTLQDPLLLLISIHTSQILFEMSINLYNRARNDIDIGDTIAVSQCVEPCIHSQLRLVYSPSRIRVDYQDACWAAKYHFTEIKLHAQLSRKQRKIAEKRSRDTGMYFGMAHLRLP